ncbi:hypothetical protein JX266_002486 [Neoarthrinium moseri]|nr:hypothetical protein JX266_002486 [Neoarthrinium moseri]
MRFPTLALLFAASLGALATPSLRGHRVRQEITTPTQCTSSAVQTITTINRGNEGIWHVKANQTGLNQLYKSTQTDWLSNNKTAVLDKCTSICFAGNNTETPGTWLPSGKYFEGAFVNTPGGSSQHPVWQCACYDNTLSQSNLAAGGGVWDNAYAFFSFSHTSITHHEDHLSQPLLTVPIYA